MGFPFYIVDVFTDTKYTGNQLAVVLDAGGLSDASMQQIAREKQSVNSYQNRCVLMKFLSDFRISR